MGSIIKGIVDRIENNIAVIETENGIINIPIDNMDIKEGYTAEIVKGKIVKAYYEQRKEKDVNAMLKKLFKVKSNRNGESANEFFKRKNLQ